MGEKTVTKYSNNTIVATIPSTINEETFIFNCVPNLEVRVVTPRARLAVMGPRIIHLNNLLLITLSGHGNPKKETVYVIPIMEKETNRYARIDNIQKTMALFAAKLDPYNRYGNDPRAGPTALVMR